MSMKPVLYEVKISKKVDKNLLKLPLKIQQKFIALVEQLQQQGPVVPEWKNFSRLGKNEYHCHLAYSYVACWSHHKNTITIEVYYAGSRENAPY